MLALLAFFALRPGKGWLRVRPQQPPHSPQPNGLHGGSAADAGQPALLNGNGSRPHIAAALGGSGLSSANGVTPAVFPAEFDPPEEPPANGTPVPAPLRPEAPLLPDSLVAASDLEAAGRHGHGGQPGSGSAPPSALPPSYVTSMQSVPPLSAVGAAALTGCALRVVHNSALACLPALPAEPS